GGDSAGGNLAAALVIKARDEGVSPPQATVLLAPITDFFFEQHESFERLAPLGIVYDTAFIGFIRGAYLVHGKNWAHPHASPARADLRNYPPNRPACRRQPRLRAKTARGRGRKGRALRSRRHAARLLFLSRHVQARRRSLRSHRGVSQAGRRSLTAPKEGNRRWAAGGGGLLPRCVAPI